MNVENTITRYLVNGMICFALIETGCGAGSSQQAASARDSPSRENDSGGASFFSNLSLKDAQGSTVDLSDAITGDIVLISFWTTYCAACKQKMTDHQALHDTYGPAGLSVLGVSVDEPETESQVGVFVRNRGLTFPVVIDSDSKLVNQINPRRTLPFSAIVDRTGKVLWTHVGYVPGDEKLFEDQVKMALNPNR